MNSCMRSKHRCIPQEGMLRVIHYLPYYIVFYVYHTIVSAKAFTHFECIVQLDVNAGIMLFAVMQARF